MANKCKCLCGKDAVATAYLPIDSVFVGLREVTEPHQVCRYHAQKATDKGHKVEFY